MADAANAGPPASAAPAATPAMSSAAPAAQPNASAADWIAVAAGSLGALLATLDI